MVGCTSAVEEPLLNLHEVVHEYIILTRLVRKMVLE